MEGLKALSNFISVKKMKHQRKLCDVKCIQAVNSLNFLGVVYRIICGDVRGKKLAERGPYLLFIIKDSSSLTL